MFYAHDILVRKRNGRFAIVWLAATMSNAKLTGLSRRDYCSVDIPHSCNEIMNQVCIQTEKPKKRLSLYLSAQLMYGLVKVYSKQNYYLMDDLNSLMTKWRLAFEIRGNIDVRETLRVEQLNFTQDEENHPDFGNFFNSSIASEDIVAQEFIEMHLSSQDIPLGLLSPNTLQHQVDNRDISLKESSFTEVNILPIPGEKELPQLSMEELKEISTSDEIAGLLSEAPLDKTLLQENEIDIDLELAMPLEETPLNLDVPPSTAAAPEKSKMPQFPDITRLSPIMQPRKASRKKLEVSLHLESVEIEDEVGKKKTRRKRLYIIDEKCRIPTSEIQENLKNTESIVRTKSVICRDFPLATMLLKNPGQKKVFYKPLLDQWKENAFTRNQTYHPDIDNLYCWTAPERESDESDIGATLPMARGNYESMEQDRAQSISREAASLEGQRVSVLQSTNRTTEREMLEETLNRQLNNSTLLPGLDQSIDDVAAATTVPVDMAQSFSDDMGNISYAEYQMELSKSISDTDLSASNIKILQKFKNALKHKNEVTFREICPVETTARSKAAKYFQVLLASIKMKSLFATQAEPYADIYIKQC